MQARACSPIPYNTCFALHLFRIIVRRVERFASLSLSLCCRLSFMLAEQVSSCPLSSFSIVSAVGCLVPMKGAPARMGKGGRIHARAKDLEGDNHCVCVVKLYRSCSAGGSRGCGCASDVGFGLMVCVRCAMKGDGEKGFRGLLPLGRVLVTLVFEVWRERVCLGGKKRRL